MKAGEKGISDLFQNGRLMRIPYFQRSYVWGKKDWERFAIDMESTLDSERRYFLGAVILKEESKLPSDSANGISQRYMVVDGQQRLTTLSIYMKVLYSLADWSQLFDFQYMQINKKRIPVIEHSREDRPLFVEVMNQEIPKEITNLKGNIVDAYNYFLKRMLPKKDCSNWLRDLINRINAQIQFVAIALSIDDDEQQIFDTINSLGVPLTTCDLVKNFLYGPADEQAYRDCWHKVFESTDDARKFWDTDASKSRQEKTKDNITIERFFHAFVRIKMWDFKDQLSEVQRKDFVKMSNVFSTCKDFVEKFELDKTISEKKQALANEIIEYARLFKENLGVEILDDENIPMYGCIKRISCFINATKQYSVIPYVLYILHEVEDEAERNQIFTYLETYLVRRILVESNNKSYSEFFAESLIGNRIKTTQDLRNFIESKAADANLSMPSNKNLKLGISTRNNSLGDTLAQTILYLYETKLSGNQIQKPYNDFYVQTLMPKPKATNTTNWPQHRKDTALEKERITLLGTLGNFFMLNSAGQKALKKKTDEACLDKVDEMRKWYDKEVIRSNHMLFNRDTDRSISDWNEETIKSRNKGLVEIFCNHIWTL